MNLGFQITDEAVQTGEESGILFQKVFRMYVTNVLLRKRIIRGSRKTFIERASFFRKDQSPFMERDCTNLPGETYFEMGDFLRSKEHYEKGSWILEHNRLWPPGRILGR